MNQEEPVSPCVSICQLNSEKICVGCGRTLQEIAVWSSIPAVEKNKVRDAAAKRLAIIEGKEQGAAA